METGKPVKKRKKRSGFKAKPPTLCWDCANATSPKCPWADRGEPVPGWDAKPTKIKFSGEKTDSYLVIKCPLFRRDAEGGGACHTLGWGWKDKNDKGDGNGLSESSRQQC